MMTAKNTNNMAVMDELMQLELPFHGSVAIAT